MLTNQLKFPKILVPSLSQNTPNIKIECAGKSKQLYYLHDQHLVALIYLRFMVFILICFQLIMLGVDLANIWLLLFEINSRIISIHELNTRGEILLKLLLKTE